ncbi:T9SS type A sorting domain-containing protein [Siansivirga zeaxanthinifaciens]|uniref:Secretion system C-terminal sorting domain-containing protein n=1 Tax=Siansivirga zeaxanthinifaciens CC-SAMT-1 TaxID=1454006 RepID=A0A0C5WFB8_9FLAO|nr:T9SS type A sorting domain-containing protein [Siansivirga zeaxanthinifaciens]AJR04897.1 hypothetical protein AW14_08930 [Siansivirga zeaxanthinifaciens CC-SAMT-1]
MTITKLIPSALIVLFFSTFSTFGQTVTTTLDPTVRDISDLNIGFNRRSDNGTWWTDTSFINLVSEMNPDVVRYPGGTQANYWDWSTGQFLENTDKAWGNKEVLLIPDFITALPSRTKIIYVVNMARPTPATGVSVNASEAVLKSDATLNLKITDMLNAIAEFVSNGKEPYAIELGNEFYFGNIEAGIFEIVEVDNNGTTEYYSGWDAANNQPYLTFDKRDATDISALFYLKQCKTVVSAIKAQYPNMKFALVTTKGGNGNSTRERWNNTIFNNLATNPEFSTLKADVDAVTQHHYLTDTYGDQTVITDNATARVAIAEGIQYPIDAQSDYDLVPNDYKIWLTEYGVTKPNADLTWASGLRFAALAYSWLNRGDKIGQLDYHYISDANVVKTGSPMILAPIGIAAKSLALASANMTEMQKITFSNNPISVNGVESLFGYKFKSGSRETVFIINISNASFSDVQIGNLFTYNGAQTLTRYHSGSPFVSGVADGDSNIVYTNTTLSGSLDARRFSISVIEVDKTLNVSQNEFSKASVFPNPTSDVLNIKASEKINSLELYNINGVKVYSKENIENQFINISKLSSGVYILKLNTNNGSEFKRIIKN